MVKPGSDPHTYEPKPSQMIALSKADIYFPIKIEFEDAWLNKFKEQNKNMHFVEMTKGVEFINMPEHGHEEETHNEEALPFEWAGVFHLKKGEYTWSFDKINGKYADPKMKFLMIKASKKSDDLIESYEEEAKKSFHSPATIATNNNVIHSNKTHELHFDENKNQTVFKITIKEDAKYLFFTEHMPFEFEDKEHFFKDVVRNDIEPILTHPESNGHHHHHHDFDPHTWVSPTNVKIMAKNIYDTLVNKDSKNTNYYKNNYEKFLKEINATDKKIKDILSGIPVNSKFMVFHPSWGYFAKEYNLIQFPIEVEGKEPKPNMLRKIIEKAKKQNVKAIFTQQEFSDKSAKAIAAQLNIKVLKETPLAKDWSQNLIRMADAISNNQ
jgi:zinc transport system substrate-binding protein